MKARIDKYGALHIVRAGNEKIQDCPQREEFPCGDWCPHFGEVEIGEWNHSEHICSLRFDDSDKHRHLTRKPDTLRLCHGTVLRGEITDERGAE